MSTSTRSPTRRPAPGSTAAPRLDAGLIKLAMVLMLGSVAAGLDTTVVNVALDTLGRHFDATVATVQWTSTAYLLGLTTVVPLLAWAVDRFGARRLWLLSLGVFGAGSMLCGVAWSMPALIAFRFLQGLGGGMLLPLVRTILARAAGPQRMGRVMTFVAVPGSLTPVLGPVLGGLVVGSLGWRWAFFLNAPICALGLVLALRVLPADAGRGAAGRVDLPGFVLVALGLGTVVDGLAAAGNHHGFAAVAVWLPLAIGVVLLAAYARHALRTDRPIVEVRLFRVRSFSASAGMLFLFGGALFGALFLVPLYFQQARGAGVLHAGVVLAPLGAGLALAMTFAGKLVDRSGAERGVALSGVVLAVAGLIPFALVTAHTSQVLLGCALFVTGLGIGAVMLTGSTATYRGLPREQVAPATSAARILQQVGGMLGTVVLAIVLQVNSTRAVPAQAFAHAFTWAAALTALAVLPALFLSRRAA